MAVEAGLRPRRSAVWIAALTAVGGILPFTIALVALRHPRWYPVMDQAMIELRVRDVATNHPPTIGLPGRIFAAGQLGSHPGPAMFWALFPVYWLLGRTAWALQVATGTLHLIAMGGAVWIGYRRGGRTAALGVAAMTVLLARTYGFEKLTLPWNPYLPALWWVVFVLAVWSVLCDDLALLPVAVLAGSFCVQTHYPYLGLVGLLGVLCVIALAAGAVRREERRRLARWVLPATALLVLLWLPPIVEQLTHDPGNLSILREAILHPTSQPLRGEHHTLGHTISIWLAHLNPAALFGHTRSSIVLAPTAPIVPGLLLLAAWVAAAVLALRRRLGDLVRFHLVLAVALVAGFVSIEQVTGDTWDYLVLWAWGTTALLVVATAWTAAVLVARPDRRAWAGWWRDRRVVAAPALLATALVAFTAAFAYDGTEASYAFAAHQADVVAHVAPATVAALRAGDPPGSGEDGRYLVLWDQDGLWFGMAGLGFYLELERQGLDVGVPANAVHEAGGRHRVLAPTDATAAIHLVIGPQWIGRWRHTPGATEVAYYEPRTPREVAEYDRLERQVRAIFVAHDRPDLVDLVDICVSLAALNHAPPEAEPVLKDMLDLGLPAAVFVAPIDVQAAA